MAENEKKDEIVPPNAGEKREVGPGKPPVEHRFSSDKQPDPLKSAETRRKKRADRDFLKQLLDLTYTFKPGSPIEALLIENFGKKAVAQMSAGKIAMMRQVQKAIVEGDTQAFKELMNQAYGLPKQKIEATGKNGGPMEMTQTITQVIINNPHAKKKEA